MPPECCLPDAASQATATPQTIASRAAASRKRLAGLQLVTAQESSPVIGRCVVSNDKFWVLFPPGYCPGVLLSRLLLPSFSSPPADPDCCFPRLSPPPDCCPECCLPDYCFPDYCFPDPLPPTGGLEEMSSKWDGWLGRQFFSIHDCFRSGSFRRIGEHW